MVEAQCVASVSSCIRVNTAMESARRLFTKKTTTQPTCTEKLSTFSKHAVLHVIFKQLISPSPSLHIYRKFKMHETYPYPNFLCVFWVEKRKCPQFLSRHIPPFPQLCSLSSFLSSLFLLGNASSFFTKTQIVLKEC